MAEKNNFKKNPKNFLSKTIFVEMFFFINLPGKVKTRSGQGQGKVRARSGQSQGKVKVRSSRQGHQCKIKAKKGQGKVKASSK